MIAAGLAVAVVDGTDEDLAELTRNGDVVAFEELYRRHRRAATAYARSILRSESDAEDAAADAFADVLAALSKRGGPRQLFRPYLLACVRNSCARKKQQRCRVERLPRVVAHLDDESYVQDSPEADIAAQAFRSLTNRWQAVLWMAEVERLDVATIAARMQLNCSATSATLHRARQAFAESYLTQHVGRSAAPTCARLAPRIARYVRGAAGPMTRRQIEAHIADCASCATAVEELTEMNSSLRSLAPPPLLGVLASGAAAAASGSTGLLAGMGTGWFANAAAVAALATLPMMSGDSRPAHADRPAVTIAEFHADVMVTANPAPSGAHVTIDADSRARAGRVAARVVVDGSAPAADHSPVDISSSGHASAAAANVTTLQPDPVGAALPSIPEPPTVTRPNTVIVPVASEPPVTVPTAEATTATVSDLIETPPDLLTTVVQLPLPIGGETGQDAGANASAATPVRTAQAAISVRVDMLSFIKMFDT
ncbi:MAG TPA: sigma-70 family RNA polymerase sigma factor [Ilumatobacteraceae bacterium]|jgi:RNA polymerase sigma factor (sigma-70 family)